MKPSSVTILYLALRSLLIFRLQKTIIVLAKTFSRTEPLSFNWGDDCDQLLPLDSIPLSRGRGTADMCYGTPIALKLANQWKHPAEDLAQQIVTHFSSTKVQTQMMGEMPLDRIWQNLLLTVTPQGWIQFRLSELGIALWLQTVTTSLLCPEAERSLPLTQLVLEDNKHFFEKSEEIFEIQYAHARCCSLLRLGRQEELVVSEASSAADLFSVPLASDPQLLPWLTSDRILILQHSVERDLIKQLFATIDDLADVSQNPCRQAIEVAYALSCQFQAFHAACPMGGAVKTHHRQLAQARLGLTRVTQTVLLFVLHHWLGVSAPVEL